MSGILIHDGRRISHRKWVTEAIAAGAADGVIVSPFASPRVARPRHPSAAEIANAALEVGGEIVFDAMTHARLLPGVNKTDFYDDWDLWPSSATDLNALRDKLEHVERVFARQSQIGSRHLTPTIPLRSPVLADADHALELASVGRGLDPDAWQSVAGSRSLWSAGADLDSFVGSLASLRAPVWVLTITNDIVLNHEPDLSDTEAFAGLCRTVRSLSLRSRVIVAHADFAGLPAVAAGADTLGTGWDRAQKTFDPNSFRVDSDPGIRIPASYVTQGGLHAVLRRDVADAIERWNPHRARAIRGGILPPSDQAQRMHHLHQLRSALFSVANTTDPQARVNALRSRYTAAGAEFDLLIRELQRLVRESDKLTWCTQPSAALESYAAIEGF